MENRRKRRTKNDIEESINRAATQLIKEKGFQDLTVTAIMQKARIEPVVFYNRYNDLNSFMDEFVKRYDYWFSNIAKGIEDIQDIKKQYVLILKSLFDSLQENEVMQQLLRWELSSNNNTTQHTARLREFYTLPLVEEYKNIFKNSNIEIDAVSALVIGGIYYLILHGNLSEFAGIDIKTDEGKQKIYRAIEYLGSIFFGGLYSNPETAMIAKKMKENGIKLSTIAECTGLEINVIKQL